MISVIGYRYLLTLREGCFLRLPANISISKYVQNRSIFISISNKKAEDPRFSKQEHLKKYGFVRFKPWEPDHVPSFQGIKLPELEDRKLKPVLKVPILQPGHKYIKMPKALHLIRGEEEVHTDFLHGQYGIVSEGGGLLKHCHFEVMRLHISRNLNLKKSFAIWRVDPPWKAHTKKGTGKRMGGGKGSISFYSTPVKAKRVILEVAGYITYPEVKRMLEALAGKLPFPARAMTQEMLDAERKEEQRLEEDNMNPYTFKYILQNNMLGSQLWAKRDIDMKYFGKRV